jgi:hypothetical protein
MAMFKRFWIFLLLCSLLLPRLIASADVLIEPNNDFYNRHRTECERLDRYFYANGASGSVSLKTEPGVRGVLSGVVENGEVINILATYNYQGETWGVTQIHTPDTPYNKLPNGWVPMSQLLPEYDSISFSEEHQSEIYSYAGNYEELQAVVEFTIWAWPGSGIIRGTFLTANLPEDMDAYYADSPAYRDEDGREWVSWGYMFGIRNVWICLSDPANDSIPAFNPEPPLDFHRSGDTAAETLTKKLSLPWLIIILVSALVVITFILIRIFWKTNS